MTTLTDLMPIEAWKELENEIHTMSGLDANIFNPEGVRISDFKEWINRLCPEIKATDKGQSFICAVAHMNVAEQARQQNSSIIEECDAGLVKMVVPIILKGEFLGAAGACGAILDDGEVDTFLIEKIAGIEESKTEPLITDIKQITREQAQKVVKFIEERIDSIISDYQQGISN
jgi:ligand-binding sensor protein